MAAILLMWWLPPRFTREHWEGVEFGLVAAVATAAITFIVLILYFGSWLHRSDWRPGYPGGFWVVFAAIALKIYWVLSVGTMAVACVMGGSLGTFAADVATRFGRLGLAFVAFLVVAGLVVPAGAVYARAKMGVGFIDLVSRFGAVRPFPARVTVALTERGRRVVLQRTVLCRKPLTSQEKTVAERSHMPKPYWLPNIKSFGQVFADGSGIFVLTPNGCKDLAIARERDGEESLRKNILTPGYRPLVGWTRDSTDLSAFDLYTDAAAFARSDAAVRVDSVTMARIAYGSRIDALDRFADIGWPDSRSRPAYSGYFAVAIPPEVWQGYTLANDRLHSISELRFVFEDYRWRPGLSKEQGLPAGGKPHLP